MSNSIFTSIFQPSARSLLKRANRQKRAIALPPFKVRLILSCAIGLVLSACGGGGLYAPCQSNLDCNGENLTCVQLGDSFGAMCTRSCTISRGRAGLPDAIDQNEFFEDGSAQQQTITDSACAESPVEVTTQDGLLEYTSEGIVGVCRLSPETAGLSVGGQSTLQGVCTPPL